jgi:hypothetical protein
VDALESCIAAKFTGARNVDCPLPRASVSALVNGLCHAPFSTWLKDVSSKDKSRWRISWNIAGRLSFRISGPHWKNIDELATALGFESLADARNPSEGSPVSLIALVPALLLLSAATEPVEKFVAGHAFQVLDSFTLTESVYPVPTTEFLLDVSRIANYMGSSVAAMDSLFPCSGDGKDGNN